MNRSAASDGELRVGLLSRGVYPRLVGGREVFIRGFAEALTRRGCEVVLVTENGMGEPIPGVGEIALRTPEIEVIDLLAYSAAFARIALPGLRGVDVVHVHSPGANIVLGAWAARTLGVPLAVTVHSMAAAESRWIWALRRAEAVVAVSPSVRERLVAGGVPTSRIRIIPSASTAPTPTIRPAEIRARLGFRPEETVFIYNGRLVEGKGLMNLAEAFSSLRTPPARLIVLGEGPMRALMENRLRACVAKETAVFVGRVKHETVSSYLAAADVAVLASESEGSPLALFEALAVGLPILATDVPGLRDFVEDGRDGTLVPRGDTVRLKDAMERLLADEGLRRRLSEGARRSAERYTIEACAERHLELYRDLVRGRRSSA